MNPSTLEPVDSGGLSLGAELAGDAARRDLRFYADSDQRRQELGLRLEDDVALGVGDDRRPPVELNAVERLADEGRDGMAGKLDEYVPASGERDDRLPAKHLVHVVGEEVLGAEDDPRGLADLAAQLVEDRRELCARRVFPAAAQHVRRGHDRFDPFVRSHPAEID